MSGSTREMNDEELVRRSQSGDARAFEAIYDRHAPGVARVLASFAGPDRDTLDDLTQEVFYRVIKNLASYTPDNAFVRWLYTITLNVGRNHARRKSRVITVDPSQFDDPPYARTADRSGSREGICHVVMHLVTTLPDEMQDVVSLRVGSDMAYDAIGEILGIPPGTVRSRMHNAIKLLREKLGVMNDQRRMEHE
jgi:RNA polymerase sigma-70 factor (ECF subfamily)